MAHHNSEFLNKTADKETAYKLEEMQSPKFTEDECMEIITVEKTVTCVTRELSYADKISENESLNYSVVTDEASSFNEQVQNVKDAVTSVTAIADNNMAMSEYNNGQEYESQRLISFVSEKRNQFVPKEWHMSQHVCCENSIRADILYRPLHMKNTEELPLEHVFQLAGRRDSISKLNERNTGKDRKIDTNERILIPKNYFKFNVPWSEELEKLKLVFSIGILPPVRFHGREFIFGREIRIYFRQYKCREYVLERHKAKEYKTRLVLMQTCKQFEGSKCDTNYEFDFIVLLLYLHWNATEEICQYLKRTTSSDSIYGIGKFKFKSEKLCSKVNFKKRKTFLWSFIVLLLRSRSRSGISCCGFWLWNDPDNNI